MTQNIIINDELKNLLPPLSPEEFAGLEEGIRKDGCLSPLVVWNDILVDGHHRYEICTKLKISFSVQNIVLDSLDDAKIWAGRHQKNRRNLSDYHRGELALRLKDAVASKAKERQRASGGDRKSESAKSVPQNFAEPIEGNETRKELAEIAGVSHTTLNKIEYICENADEETKAKLRKREKGTSIHKEYKRLKAEEKTEKQPRSKSTKKTTKSGKKASETVVINLKSRPKVNERYSCGVVFEPDPDDDFFDWITDEERTELKSLQATCPNRLVPSIHNFTIQNIPEHTPEPLVSCLYSLFKVGYREKLAYILLRKIFHDDDATLARTIIAKLQNEFQNQ